MLKRTIQRIFFFSFIWSFFLTNAQEPKRQASTNQSNIHAESDNPIVNWLRKNVKETSPLQILFLTAEEVEALALKQANQIIPSKANAATIIERIRLVIHGIDRMMRRWKTRRNMSPLLTK